MFAPPAASVDRVRGVATGLLTAALAVAAHGAGGGAVPTGATAALLAVVAATAGAVATTLSDAHSARHLLALLAVGQLLGHFLLLSAASHHHADPAAAPAAAMFVAHLLAIVAGATLIGAGDRLWRALSHTVRTIVPVASAVAATPAAVPRVADQPLRSALQLAASMSHRGPPVSLAR